MNRFFTLLIAVAALALTAFGTTPCLSAPKQVGQSAPADQGLSIIALSSRRTYASGDPIKIDVIVRNGGQADAGIGGSAFDLSSFRFAVIGPTSHLLAPTAFARKLLAIPTKVKTNTPLKIGAGWQRRYQFDLSRMYDLTNPGMYSITVKRVVVVGLTDGGGHQARSRVLRLASDPIAITITGTPAALPAAAPAVRTGKVVSKWTIAFVREGDIWLADSQGNEQRLVIHDGDAPCWSPDKSLIAFARKGNVWVSDAYGQNQRQLTDSPSLEAGVNPVFSPNGKWIAYRSWNQRTGIMVRIVSLDGKTDKELLQDGEEPAW